MIPARIGVDVDRRLTLRDRVARWASRLLTAEEAAAVRARLDDGSRQVGLIARVVLFVLSSWAFGTAMSLVLLVFFPAFMDGGTGDVALIIQGVIALVAGIAGAEFLLSAARLRRTGIEDALYLGGFFGFLMAVLNIADVEAEVAVALCGVAFLLVALRLHRGLWLAAAIGCIPGAIGAGTESPMAFGVAGLATSLVAAVAGLRRWRSPALQLGLSIIVALLPGVSLFITILDRLFADRLIVSDLLMSGVVTAVAFGAFVATRWKALLYASVGSFAVFVFIFASNDLYPVEWVLLVTGAALVIASRLAHSALERRPSGFTSAALGSSELADLEPLVGAAAGAFTAPRVETAEATGPAIDDAASGTDSSFGGGGSSGRY